MSGVRLCGAGGAGPCPSGRAPHGAGGGEGGQGAWRVPRPLPALGACWAKRGTCVVPRLGRV